MPTTRRWGLGWKLWRVYVHVVCAPASVCTGWLPLLQQTARRSLGVPLQELPDPSHAAPLALLLVLRLWPRCARVNFIAAPALYNTLHRPCAFYLCMWRHPCCGVSFREHVVCVYAACGRPGWIQWDGWNIPSRNGRKVEVSTRGLVIGFCRPQCCTYLPSAKYKFTRIYILCLSGNLTRPEESLRMCRRCWPKRAW